MEEDNRERTRIAIAVLGLVAATLFVVWYFYQYRQDVLIRGVPYNGNFAGTIISTAPQSVAAMITRYWGDERVSLGDIRYRIFRFGTPHSNVKSTIYLSDYAAFFKEQGYEASIKRFKNTREFRSYLRRGVPLILALKLPSETYAIIDHSVLIGHLPSKSVFVFHSNLLGNNYEMTFKDFEASWAGRENDKVFLAVRPSSAIRSVIRGPDPAIPYPHRLGIMDSKPLRELRFKIRYADELSFQENTARLWEEIVNAPAFADVRPMGKVNIYMRLAQEYAAGTDPLRAIDTAIRFALPLNHDLEKAYGEWPMIQGGKAGFEWDVPWKLLGDFYFQAGNLRLAKESYLKAAALAPENPFTPEKIKKVEAAEKGQK